MDEQVTYIKAGGWWPGGKHKWTEERRARLKELYNEDNRASHVVEGMKKSFPDEHWSKEIVKSQAQRMGICHRRNRKYVPFSQRISVITTPSTNRLLAYEAARRGVSKSKLISSLLSVVVKDNLFEAVIGDTNGYGKARD